MRNRAKCKKCLSIIESFHATDLVECKCGEIALDAGDALKCYAKDWSNFLRIDDKDQEVVVVIQSKDKLDDVKSDVPPITKEDKLKALDELIGSYDKLPQHAMLHPATNYDILSVLLLVKSLLTD